MKRILAEAAGIAIGILAVTSAPRIYRAVRHEITLMRMKNGKSIWEQPDAETDDLYPDCPIRQ